MAELAIRPHKFYGGEEMVKVIVPEVSEEERERRLVEVYRVAREILEGRKYNVPESGAMPEK